jgi:uncharacterized protein YpmS
MRPQYHRWMLAVVFILVSTLACRLNLGGPDKPTHLQQETFPTEENLLVTIIPTLDGMSVEQSISVSLTEAQLNSLIISELNAQEKPIINDPLVILGDGQIDLYGSVSQGYVSGNVHIIITAEVDDQGNPDFSIISATVGPFPLPEGMLSQFSKILDESLSGKLGPEVTGVRIEDIKIDPGTMTITGVSR